MSFIPKEEDFFLKYDDENTFSFFESEDGEIFSYGHRNKEELLLEVVLYDLVCDNFQSKEEYLALKESVSHTWATIEGNPSEDDEWKFTFGADHKEREGSFPITVIHR